MRSVQTNPMTSPGTGGRQPKKAPANARRAAFGQIQRDIGAFSARAVGLPLYPYQAEIGQYCLLAVAQARTEDITIEMSRQSGKNELSAQLEAEILTRYGRSGGMIVKGAPTWLPQIVR